MFKYQCIHIAITSFQSTIDYTAFRQCGGEAILATRKVLGPVSPTSIRISIAGF